MNRTERARTCFNSGYSCSQAVIAAFADDFGLDSDMALRIAGGFGGGMGGTGGTCGALSGAVMAIGLKYRGTGPAPSEEREITYAKVKEAVHRFESVNGARNCRDILGVPIDSPENAQYAREQGLYDKYCPDCVRNAVIILEEILDI